MPVVAVVLMVGSWCFGSVGGLFAVGLLWCV